MKKAKSVALVAAGNLTDSFVSKFYWLSDRLGPVKSTSIRLASRIVNYLRAGHPVDDWTEFNSCDLILVYVHDRLLAQTLGELSSSGIDFRGKAVVLCSVWHGSSELAELCACGAAVGSIGPIPGFEDLRYLIEGDPLAVREARRLVEHRGRRGVVIERSLKPLFLAALTCTGSVLFSVVMAASESLRHAGITPLVSASILERQLGRTLRSYVRAGRKAFPVPRDLQRQIRALAAADPALARYIEDSSRLAERLLEGRQAQAAGR